MGIELKHILKCALIPACLTLLFAIVTRLCFIGFSGEFFFVVAPAICLVLSAFATPVTCIWAGAVRFKRGLVSIGTGGARSLPAGSGRLLFIKFSAALLSALSANVFAVLSALIILIAQPVNVMVGVDSVLGVVSYIIEGWNAAFFAELILLVVAFNAAAIVLAYGGVVLACKKMGGSMLFAVLLWALVFAVVTLAYAISFLTLGYAAIIAVLPLFLGLSAALSAVVGAAIYWGVYMMIRKL